ncbi:phosphoribosylaminoimidazolesuccinocarboxamide synthase [soil metagenome]
MSVDLQDLILAYDGSVKRVWRPEGDDGSYWFEFTDDYSVFDWGKMPDTIANKGKALVALGAFFFQHLADNKTWINLSESVHLSKFNQDWLNKRINQPLFQRLTTHGARHHFQGLVGNDGKALSLEQIPNNQAYMSVVKAEVQRPEPTSLLDQTVFYYSHDITDARRLVPLEVVFRFGMPPGSSLKSRLEADPSYAQTLGLSSVPEYGWFERPVLEFYTKLEPKDRLLSIQEALTISGLTPKRFEELSELAYATALAIYHHFAECGIELWDGKFEFLEDHKGLLLADSIGPDELRLVYSGHSLSKEMIRQFYRDSSWQKAISKAQKMALSQNRLDWQEICIKDLKEQPSQLSPQFKAVADKLYGVLANHTIGYDVFPQHPTLPQFVDSINVAAKDKE